MAGPLKTYDITIQGNRTQMKLTDDDAQRLGATEVTTKKRTAANKARTVETARTADVASADEVEDQDDGNVCAECGFEAKTAGGLASHQRSHEA